MGLANWLTLLRILLIPVFVTLLVYEQRGPALAVFLAAALTDSLDGWVARQRGSQSRLGAFLDPLADKLLLVSSFVTLTWLRALPFWIAAVVISRDVILMVGALAIHMAGGRITPRPSRVGKLATFFQILTVLLGLLAPFYALPPLTAGVLALAAEQGVPARPIGRTDGARLRIRVDGAPAIDVNSGAVVTGLVGPLDYSFRTYTIDPDPGATIGVAGGAYFFKVTDSCGAPSPNSSIAASTSSSA